MGDLLWPIRDAWLSALAVRSQRGDRGAFRDLYRALYAPVLRFVQRRVAGTAEAEEIVSQVFLRLVESLDQVNARRGVRAYVFRMARNALTDHARARLRVDPSQLLAALPADEPGALQKLEAAEERARVRAALATMPADTRELVLLRFGDGLRHAEIAQLLELSEAAVRQRLSRAVRELKTRLEATARMDAWEVVDDA